MFQANETAAILIFQTNKMAAVLVYQEYPGEVELFSYVNAFLCSHNELAYMLAL